MPAVTLSIFARWPEPGKAKTRLIPDFGPEGAAAIYAKLLEHTIRAAEASGLDFELRVTGAMPEAFRDRFGNDLRVVDQGDGDLTAKLSRVLAPAIVIGSDCPGLTPELLKRAAESLATHETVIGPARDGGYYLLGFNLPAPHAFDGIAWSTPSVFADTMARFRKHGIEPHVLPELSDVDTATDLEDWPQFLP